MKTPEEKKKSDQEYRSRPEVRERIRLGRIERLKDPEAKRLKLLRGKKYRDRVKNTPEFKAKNAAYAQRPEVKTVTKARRIDLKRKLDLLKMGRPCYDCGGEFPLEAMDWDHLPGKEKCFGIGNYSTRSLEEVLEEIQKCQLVCSNCHRIRNAARRPETISSKHLEAIKEGRERKRRCREMRAE